MCGITGAVPGIDPGLLRRMTAALAHRGPDGDGYFSAPEASLGHRRLAIIDLRGGAQPITTPDGRFTLIFNGEIYNFRALRSELESLGEQFRTQSDTEVLLHAFARWGRDALDRLRGMFAFAVWDRDRRALFLARDRLGLKPLYYSFGPRGQLVFASEIAALLEHPEISRALDLRAVDDYLAYLYIPAPRTIFAQIRELPPAHWLEWCDGTLRIERYWDALPEPREAPEPQLTEELLATLDEAVRLRMISDVPLGAFLSGGMDSSSIVALMARAAREPVRTFSLDFRAGEERYSELEFARMVSSRYATEHRELEIQPQCADLLPRMVEHFGQPFGNPTALLVNQLSQLTRRHVTVALAGDAGDEVFLGYPRYAGVRLRGRLDRIPLPARRALAWLSGSIAENSNGNHARRRAREFLSTAAQPWHQAYAAWVGYFSAPMREALYAHGFRAQLEGYRAEQFLEAQFARVRHAAPLDQASYVDLHTFLPFNLLAYGDRMSMAHALEVRLPFTDHKLVEFAMRLPAHMKLRGGESKYLLRRAVGPLLPREILTRSKLGLNPPLGLWLRGELVPLLDRYLSPHAVAQRGWFDPQAVAQLLTDFRAGRRDYSLHLWSLLVLEQWCQRYLDRAPAPEHEPHALGALA
jgi:asparagine synthase (glutamine-hydrolysing)